MSSVRVVLVMIEPPLPFGNAAARWFYVLLRGLVARGHRVTAFAACSNDADIEPARDQFPAPDYDLRLFGHPRRAGGMADKLETIRRPYSYMFGADLRAALHEQLQTGFDVLHLEQLWAGWLGLDHTRRALVNVHYLVDIDLAATGGRLLDRFRQTTVRRAERRLLRSYPHVTALTPRLTGRIRDIAPASTTRTIPLALDLSLYPWPPPSREPDRPPRLGLIGSFTWAPTYSAGVRLLTRLWPAIARRVPSAELAIVGRNARGALAALPHDGRVRIEENVPDILPHFHATDVMLYAPARGSGMKVKVMESMALGVPVVTNDDGAEGIPIEDEVHADVCESDDALVDRAVRLLTDTDLRRRRAEAARRLLETHCEPNRILDAFETAYRDVRDAG